MAATGFPTFQDGDVKIIISGSRQYMLHSSILKSVSPRLQDMLKDEHAANLSSKAIKRGVTARYRLVAIKNNRENCDDEDVEYFLEPVTLNEDGKPQTGRSVALDLENGLIAPRSFRVSETSVDVRACFGH